MDKFPYIYSIKPLKEEFSACKVIHFRSNEGGVQPSINRGKKTMPKSLSTIKRYDKDYKFKLCVPCPHQQALQYAHMGGIDLAYNCTLQITMGRSLENMFQFAHLSISRKHCKIQKKHDKWVLQDTSLFGISVNGQRIIKNTDYELQDSDIIQLDPLGEFTYKYDSNEDNEIPRKRIKIEHSSEIIDNMKVKFEESQNNEKEHLEEKIMNAKQLQHNTIIMKEQLERDMARQIEELKLNFAAQIENLRGEKNEVERQKSALEEERDNQLTSIKQVMEEKISNLLEQIQKHNEAESELVQENNSLKEKLIKEREEFLAELNRECSSKQDMLEQLEGKIREQEEARVKEKQEFEENLKTKTEQLQAIKEKELQDLEEQKRIRESELQQQLADLRNKAELAEIEKTRTEQQLLDRIELMTKQNEQIKQMNQSKERERELVQLKAQSVQVKQSTEITSLQMELDTVRSQLASVETEKKALQENRPTEVKDMGTIQQVCNVMDAELQCSICSELFLCATTLNCSHTFCRYCIKKWMRTRNECPNCRSLITSDCRSLVLDSFIDRMAGLTDEMKTNRLQIVKEREELEAEFNRGAVKIGGGETYDEEDLDSELIEEEEEEDEHDYYYRHYDYDEEELEEEFDEDDF